MTDLERKGLEVAAALLERELAGGNGPDDEAELRAALEWIYRQYRIDTRRRTKRGKYKRGRQ